MVFHRHRKRGMRRVKWLRELRLRNRKSQRKKKRRKSCENTSDAVPLSIQHFCFVDTSIEDVPETKREKERRPRVRHTRYWEDPTIRKDITCYTCQGNHLAKDCPNRACYYCHEVGHKAFECPKNICNWCREHGHYARACPLWYTWDAKSKTGKEPNDKKKKRKDNGMKEKVKKKDKVKKTDKSSSSQNKIKGALNFVL